MTLVRRLAAILAVTALAMLAGVAYIAPQVFGL